MRIRQQSREGLKLHVSIFSCKNAQAVMGIGCWQCWVPDPIGSRQKDRES